MAYTLALLFSLLQLLRVGAAAPVPLEVIKMKSKVKWMAEQVVVRLNQDLQIPVDLTFGACDDDLDGTASIVTVLEGYNSLISDSFDGVSQVKLDIASLTGYLDQWRRGHCSERRAKPAAPGRLQQLQSQKEYVHTVSVEAVIRVKEFLELLLKNLDHLETC